MIQELDPIQDDTDQMQIKLRKMLYTIESRYNPTDGTFFIKLLNGLAFCWTANNVSVRALN